MRRLELALAEVHHVQHIGSEAKTVAELLNTQGNGDDHNVSGLCDSQIDERQARQRHTCRHHPQRFLEAHTRGVDTSQNTTQQQGNHAKYAIDGSHHLGAQAQTALLGAMHKERLAQLDQEALGQAVQQHKGNCQQESRLLDKGHKGVTQLSQVILGSTIGALVARLIVGRARQGKGVVQRDQEEDGCRHAKRDLPRHGNVARLALDEAGNEHQSTLTEDRSHTVKDAADADKRGLAAGTVGQHVEAVGSDVMGSTGECSDDEQHKREPEDADRRVATSNGCSIGMRQRQRQQNEHRGHYNLHGDNPPAFGLHHVHNGTPDALEEPREIQQGREERHVAVGDTHLGEHHHRDVIDHKVGHALGKVEGRHPPPWGLLFRIDLIVFHIFI